MTVVATDGHTMAADGLTANGWTIVSTTSEKVHVLPDGSLFGASGDVDAIKVALAWFRDGGEKPKIEGDMSILVVSPDGTIKGYEKSLAAYDLPAPQALGCGKEFAFAAMDLGASPERAVEAACARSMGCGGTMKVIRLGDDHG
jgi:ATP-dependent protease HslVU (ClpYQ) peptidase subunit